MISQEFYWKRDTDEFYYANFQEEVYIKISKKDKELYEFFNNIHCVRWENRQKKMDNFNLVGDINDRAYKSNLLIG